MINRFSMMVRYVNGVLHLEDVDLSLLAKKFGTPLYVYTENGIKERIRSLKKAFGSSLYLLAYAVKANSNLGILKIIKNEGCGAEVVSGGEFYRALLAGINPKKIVFTGVGKTAEEIELAIKKGIFSIVCESEGELRVIEEVSKKLKKRARVMLRVNPDVSPNTHPYIATGLRNSKFGIPQERAYSLYKLMAESRFVEPIGIHFHIGSQITSPDPFYEASQKIRSLWTKLRDEGIKLKFIDAGGGIGIQYKDGESGLSPEAYASAIREGLKGVDAKIIIEPGRFIVGNNGILIGKVLYVKDNGAKRFLVTDIGMNDLIRPSLYNSYHRILPVIEKKGGSVNKYDVVGPVCESGDFIARDRELPEINSGEFIAVLDAGAYGFSMASNYNSRPRPAEVIVKGKDYKILRKRENYRSLVKGEVF